MWKQVVGLRLEVCVTQYDGISPEDGYVCTLSQDEEGRIQWPAWWEVAANTGCLHTCILYFHAGNIYVYPSDKTYWEEFIQAVYESVSLPECIAAYPHGAVICSKSCNSVPVSEICVHTYLKG